MNFQYYEGNDRPANEKRDCTVRALAMLEGISYSEAHSKLAKAGRKTGHRFNFTQYMICNYYTINRLEPKRTVRLFIKDHPKGLFIVHIKGHVFALKDGVIYDTYSDYLNHRVDYYVTPKDKPCNTENQD